MPAYSGLDLSQENPSRLLHISINNDNIDSFSILTQYYQNHGNSIFAEEFQKLLHRGLLRKSTNCLKFMIESYQTSYKDFILFTEIELEACL